MFEKMLHRLSKSRVSKKIKHIAKKKDIRNVSTLKRYDFQFIALHIEGKISEFFINFEKLKKISATSDKV